MHNPNAKFHNIHWKKPVVAAGLQIYLEKRFRHRCFLVDFAKLLRTAFLLNTNEQVLLKDAQILENLCMKRIQYERFDVLANYK